MGKVVYELNVNSEVSYAVRHIGAKIIQNCPNQFLSINNVKSLLVRTHYSPPRRKLYVQRLDWQIVS